MRQKLTLITLGVDDFDKAVSFYEEGLAWKKSPASVESMAIFPLGGIVLALHPKSELAEDANAQNNGSGFPGITLSYNAKSEEEVNTVLAKVAMLGARIIKQAQKVYWGGYSGYFEAPGGHYIEVAFNPYWEFDENDNLKLPE